MLYRHVPANIYSYTYFLVLWHLKATTPSAMAGGKVTPIAELRAVIQDCHDRCLYASAKMCALLKCSYTCRAGSSRRFCPSPRASDLLSGMHCSQEVSEVLRKDPVEESLLSEYDALAVYDARSDRRLPILQTHRRPLYHASESQVTLPAQRVSASA